MAITPTQYILNSISWLLTPPSDKLKKRVNEARCLGTSESNGNRYFWAPLKAVSASVTAISDVVTYPLRGLNNAVLEIIDLAPLRASASIIMGVLNSARSLVQVAIIVSILVVGIILPKSMYRMLPDARTTQPVVQIATQDAAKVKDLEKQLQKIQEDHTAQVKQVEESLQTATQQAQQLPTLQEQLRKTQEEHTAQVKKLEEQLQAATQQTDPTQSQQYVGLKKQYDELNQQFQETNTTVKQQSYKYEEINRQFELAKKEKEIAGIEHNEIEDVLQGENLNKTFTSKNAKKIVKLRKEVTDYQKIAYAKNDQLKDLKVTGSQAVILLNKLNALVLQVNFLQQGEKQAKNQLAIESKRVKSLGEENTALKSKIKGLETQTTVENPTTQRFEVAAQS